MRGKWEGYNNAFGTVVKIRMWPLLLEAESIQKIFPHYCVGFSTGLNEEGKKGSVVIASSDGTRLHFLKKAKMAARHNQGFGAPLVLFTTSWCSDSRSSCPQSTNLTSQLISLLKLCINHPRPKPEKQSTRAYHPRSTTYPHRPRWVLSPVARASSPLSSH